MKDKDALLNELVKDLIGSDAVSLVDYIKNKEDVSEFKIAEVLGININLVRNMLYRLSAHNLVSFKRKKDKKKGWYIYYWTFDLGRASELLLKLKEKKMEQLRGMLDRMKNESFFVCERDGLTLSYESALEHNFKCPEDGELLRQKDNRLDIERLRKEIEKLEVEVAEGFELETKQARPRKKERIIAKKEKKERRTKKKSKIKIIDKKLGKLKTKKR